MKDNTLYKISLFISLVGLLGLVIFTFINSPKEMKIENISQEDVGKRVEISGRVGSKTLSEDGHLFFHVKEEESKIDVVLFKEDFKSMNLDPDTVKEDRKIKIQGDIELYEGNLQIQPLELEFKN